MESTERIINVNKAKRTYSQPLLPSRNEFFVPTLIKKDSQIVTTFRNGSQTPPGTRRRSQFSNSGSPSQSPSGSNTPTGMQTPPSRAESFSARRSIEGIYLNNRELLFSYPKDNDKTLPGSPCTPPCTPNTPLSASNSPSHLSPLHTARKSLNPCHQLLHQYQPHDQLRRHSSLKNIPPRGPPLRADSSGAIIGGSDSSNQSGTLTPPLAPNILPQVSDMTRHLSLTKLKDMLPVR